MDEEWRLLAEVVPAPGGGFGEADQALADRLESALQQTGSACDEIRFRYVLGPGRPLMRVETRSGELFAAWQGGEPKA